MSDPHLSDSNEPVSQASPAAEITENKIRPAGLSEDWTAVVVGVAVVILALVVALFATPEGFGLATTWPADSSEAVTWNSPLKSYIGKPAEWASNPLNGLIDSSFEGQADATVKVHWPAILGAGVILLLLCGAAAGLRGIPLGPFLAAFPGLFLLALVAYILAGQGTIKDLNLEYALWALLLGLIISNTIGLPAWLRPAVQGELYIKTGLVLLGAGVLMGRLVALGVPGIFVAWVVTPIVLISTYIFGQKVLKMESRSLNMVISADMSVCGVSAAIATAAACKAKKDELSLAVGLSLSFTVIMMIVMPSLISILQLPPVVGGAWIGGTIDATGAVVAAGEMLVDKDPNAGKIASEAAVTIKMIQNILIGVTAFLVAIYWTTVIEKKTAGESKVGIGEIWKRFPKFVVGFIAVSLIMSVLAYSSYFGDRWVEAAVKGTTKGLRGWLFCLAFVCIGLETNFKQLLPYFKTGKPAVLYIAGQSLNLILTLAMAYLMFGVLFKDQI